MLVHWKRGKGEPDAAPELLREVTVAVACGNTHSASVTAAGDALTWGSGGFGELGDGELTEERAAPAPVPGLRGGARVVAVSCGFYHTAAVRDDGSVWAWGWGRHGQLGLGAREQSAAPARVEALAAHRATAVACGHYATAVVAADGGVFSWGELRAAAASDEPPAAAARAAAGGANASVAAARGDGGVVRRPPRRRARD